MDTTQCQILSIEYLYSKIEIVIHQIVISKYQNYLININKIHDEFLLFH